MTIATQLAAATLDLPSSLRIADVAELRPACEAALRGDGPLVCDGSRVELIDAAGLQLVAALARACAEGGRGFELRTPSVALCSAAQLGDFARHFGLATA